MKFKTTIVFILLCSFSYAQKGRGLSLGLNFSPNYDNFIFTGKNNDFFHNVYNYKKPYWGYTYGLTLRYMFNNRAGFETGALLTRKGCTLQEDSNPSEMLYTEDYLSAEIPLKLGYKIIDVRFSCSVNLGINLSFTYKQKGDVIYYDVNKVDKGIKTITYRGEKHIVSENYQWTAAFLTAEPKTQKRLYRVLNFIPTASLAFSYRLSDRISLGLEPSIRFSLLNQAAQKYETIIAYYPKEPNQYIKPDRDSGISQIFWNYGINTSVYYHF